MKHCKKCSSDKDESDFNVRAASRDGLSSMCKSCQRQYDSLRSGSAKRKAARDEYSKTDAGIESIKKAKAKYAEKNKGKISKSQKEYRENNREKIRALGRDRYDKNKEYYSNWSVEYRAKYPNKYKAHSMVNNAVRSGKIKKENCEECGEKGHAHHDDYQYPLTVRWLCPSHHKQWHAENGEALNP